MRRRAFIRTCSLATVGAGVAHRTVATAQTRLSDAGARAITALNMAKQLEIKGDFKSIQTAYHSDAILVEPGSLQPNIGRASIAQNLQKGAGKRRLLYFYYRQPQVVELGNAALVVSNYEAGYESGGKTTEDSGKTTNVVVLGSDQPVITQDVQVPNIYAGGYGPLGTALSAPKFGLFPIRVLGREPTTAKSAGGGENDVLFNQVRQINESWVTGRAEDLLKYANRSGVFLVGDYSPFYLSGIEDVRQHFADFYRTSKVTFVREVAPTVRIWGDMAAVAFNFDLDYTINGKPRRSPGRAVYTFAKGGSEVGQWAMAACAASHLVLRDIGDPYPLNLD